MLFLESISVGTNFEVIKLFKAFSPYKWMSLLIWRKHDPEAIVLLGYPKG